MASVDPLALLAGLAAADDEFVAGLLGLASATLRATLRIDGVTAAGGLSFSTAVWVVDRVHGDTSDLWPNLWSGAITIEILTSFGNWLFTSSGTSNRPYSCTTHIVQGFLGL